MITKKLIPKRIKPILTKGLMSMWVKSLNSAAREQNLDDLAKKLKEIVPDIENQYSMFKVDNPYLKTKVRYQHAFQISLVNKVVKEFNSPTIVDIGDSAGTHLQYLMRIHSGNIRCLSVNLDPKAVEKIKRKGLECVHAKAEDLHKYNINANIFLCFQTLEHMMNPCHFLHELSSKTNANSPNFMSSFSNIFKFLSCTLHVIKSGNVVPASKCASDISTRIGTHLRPAP